MTTLNFTDSEPPMSKKAGASKELFSGNAAIYDRLQGRTKKSAMAKYGWIGIPVAAVAVLGIVAVTSTPNRSADNIAAGPVDAKPAIVASQITAPTQTAEATPTQVRETIEAGSAAASAPLTTASAPVVRRSAPVTHAASAAPVQIIPAPAQSPTGPTTVNPPAAAMTPAPALIPVPDVAAPAAADPAPAPADAAPAAAETTPVQ